MDHMANYALRISTLTLCLATFCPTTAFPQVDSDVSSAATAAAAPVADVYVGTTNGVYLYDAAPNGSLSRVPVAPRAVKGVAIGSNRKYFLSLDSTYLHSYTQTSDGKIMSQASFINTQTLSGNECGTAKGAVLDHTGQYIYVLLYPAKPVGTNEEACAAVQTVKIGGIGALSFLGATQFATETETGLNTAFTTPLKLSGNGGYAYTASLDHDCFLRTWELKRESSGTMLFNTYERLTVPSTPPEHWDGWVGAADPINHMAVAMTRETGDFEPCGDPHLTQLASFTMASDGNLTTTNTPDKMPTPKVHPAVLNMSPSGQFLAVGGNESFTVSSGAQTPGLQVFHFNSANPITAFSKVLTTAPIDGIRWDNNNHLYALSNSTKKLYAYTVTSSGITAVPGSPSTIASTPNALVVVPTSTACSAPSSNGVHICAPTNGSTVSSPVTVKAASTVSGTIARMELWVDGVKKYTAPSTKQLNTTISLAAGSHRFSVFAINTAAQKWQSVVTATVK
jgi:Big-like domain-containing protein